MSYLPSNILEEEKIKISIEPEKNITFVCSKNQIIGIVKIYLESMTRKNYAFQIKTTAKHHYKLSQPNGFIRKSPKIIYVYLYHINTLEQTLHDKFKISVIDPSKQKTLFTKTLGIIIQSNVNLQKDELFLQPNNNTSVSRIGSNYTTPSIMGQQSGSKMSSLRMTTIEEKMIISKVKASKSNFSLKDRLNQSAQTLQKKKNKESKLERQIKNKKASTYADDTGQRFMIYLILLILMIGFVVGFQTKRYMGKKIPKKNPSVWGKVSQLIY